MTDTLKAPWPPAGVKPYFCDAMITDLNEILDQDVLDDSEPTAQAPAQPADILAAIRELIAAPPPKRSRKESSPDNGKKGGRPPAPPHALVADSFARLHLKDESGRFLVRHWHGEWYAYSSAGWSTVPEGELLGRLMTFLRIDPELNKHANCAYAASVLLNLRAHDLCGLPESIRRPCWLNPTEDAQNWVAFSNGQVVNLWQYAAALAAGTDPGDYIRPVSPDFFSSDFVSYPWQPDATAEKFQTYLARVQPDGENVAAIARMLGLLCVERTAYEVFFQLYGTGRNGKTVLLDIISALIGPQNVSYVPLQGLIVPFQMWPIAFSKVNISGEMPTDIQGGHFHQIEGVFKNVVSGGFFEVEKKNKDVYSAPCRARFVLAANTLPSFMDRSDGIWRRLRIIPFPTEITETEKDVDLARKIIATDMPGVMQWALQGLADIIARGNVPDCPSGAEWKEKHRSTCDHERIFLTDYYAASENGNSIQASELYKEYHEWIKANGYKPLGSSKLYARVSEVFPSCIHAKRRFLDLPNPVWAFDGIRSLNSPDDGAL